MNLIILFESDELEGGRYRVRGDRAKHIREVLGCGAGETVEVGILNGERGTGTIVTIDREMAVMDCMFDARGGESRVDVDLICALPRPQTLKKVLESTATMGVRRIHLINSWRVQKCYFSSSIMEQDNLNEHLIKGLCQGRLTRLPEVRVHRRFKLFFHETLDRLESEEEFKAKRLLPDLQTDDYLAAMDGSSFKRAFLAIGPEGGWIDREVETMAGKGFEKFKLGAWPLRVENAVVAAISQLELAVGKPKT